MEVTVTLFGGLRHYLPAGSSFNKCTINLDEGGSLESLLRQLPIPAEKPYLVILNDEKVTQEKYAEVTIHSGDDVVLLPPIKGG